MASMYVCITYLYIEIHILIQYIMCSSYYIKNSQYCKSGYLRVGKIYANYTVTQ
jgi:hypothetical protein